MMTEAEVELPGESRRHLVRLRFFFEIGRPAPRCSDHDSPGFSDPGEPGCAEITAGVVILERDGKALRERSITKKTLDRMRDDSKLENYLYEQALENCPRA